MADPWNLERFVQAQDGVYQRVCAELRRGRKTTHWMWFIFPQMRGLGRSATAVQYGIASLAEAQAYAAHPMLGARLRECCRILLDGPSADAHSIFGHPDDLKLRSGVTLFKRAAPEEAIFADVLEKFFAAQEDQATLTLLSG